METVSGDLTAWLRAEIERDRDDAARRLRLSRMTAAHRDRLVEKLDRAKAELAVLDLCERVIREDKGAHEDCGAAGSWTGLAVARLNLRLMASGYRHRKGYEAEWARS